MTKITEIELNNLAKNLLNEALEGLKYGLKYNFEYCTGGNIGLLKQSIMNFHRFTELALKFFIANINPLLIFEKPFDENFILKNSKTITFTQALNFFSNNLDLGILNITPNFKQNEFRKTLHLLRDLRNDVAHLFLITNDEAELQTIFSDNVRLIYLIFIEQNIHQKIETFLSSEEKEMLEELIDIEEEKLKKEEEIKLAFALKQVEVYEKLYSSSDPKEVNPLDAPIYDCPNCDNPTFILTDDEKRFKCTYCRVEEDADTCTSPFGCGSGLIPSCYLSIWDEETGTKFCDHCRVEYNNKMGS